MNTLVSVGQAFDFSLKSHYLTDEVLQEMMELVMKYKDRINREAIFRGVKWG